MCKYTTEECLQEYCLSLEEQLAEKDAMIDWLAEQLMAKDRAVSNGGFLLDNMSHAGWREAARKAVENE